MTDIEVRRLEKQNRRVETGVTQFKGDWPGVFIRGDDCFRYVQSLGNVLKLIEDHKVKDDVFGALAHSHVTGLMRMLESSNVRNHQESNDG